MFKKFKILIGKESEKAINVTRTNNGPIETQTHMRSHRTRQVPNRLACCELLPDNAVSNDDDLIHFALSADAESMCHNEKNKSKAWRETMMKELRSIGKSHTW